MKSNQAPDLRASALILLLFLVPAINSFAGFNDILDGVLEEESLTYGSAAWLVLTGSGMISNEASVDDAVLEMGALLPKLSADRGRTVTLGEFSLMVMKCWKIPGGLFFRLFPSPRYALRELRFLDIVQGRAYSRMTLSGERAVRIIGRVIDQQEVQS